jgi:hypothetical protein
VSSEGRQELNSKKRIYTAPRLKAIYSAPRLTEHGAVAKLTLASMLPAGFHNGNQNYGPPAISSSAVPGNDNRRAVDHATGLPVVNDVGIQKAGGNQQEGGGDQQQGGGDQQQAGSDQQQAGGNQQEGSGDQQKPGSDQQQGGGDQQKDDREGKPKNR